MVLKQVIKKFGTDGSILEFSGFILPESLTLHVYGTHAHLIYISHSTGARNSLHKLARS